MVGSVRYVAAMIALTCGVFAGVVSTEPQHPYRRAAPVCVEITAKDYLAGPAHTTMREEATRIWLRHGIALKWTRQPLAECEVVVPIVFDADRLATISNGKHADALAVTVFSGASRVVYVSLPRAFQLLSQIREVTRIESSGERDLRGGMLLGRIIAHELGHVLLTTMSHSQTGLMRPVYGLSDVMSADDRMTDLSSIETGRLAMRFSLIPLESGTTPPAIAGRR